MRSLAFVRSASSFDDDNRNRKKFKMRPLLRETHRGFRLRFTFVSLKVVHRGKIRWKEIHGFDVKTDT